jgi:hypothetical protein
MHNYHLKLHIKILFSLDLKILTTDTIDILQHFIPTESEVKAFASYLSDGKSILNLSDEDRFLYGVRERFITHILFMMNFLLLSFRKSND